jgi:hypothetical protein
MHIWRRAVLSLLISTLLVLVPGCSEEPTYHLRSDTGATFTEPVSIRVEGVTIGKTGRTGLTADNEVYVVARIDPEYRGTIRQDTRFVLTRTRLGFGSPTIEAIPGRDAVAPYGTVFDLVDETFRGRLQTNWDALLDQVRDPSTRERLSRLRQDAETWIDAGRDRWSEHAPELEERASALIHDLRNEGSDAATDFTEWWEEVVAEHTARQ